jgi:hypothetical protein
MKTPQEKHNEEQALVNAKNDIFIETLGQSDKDKINAINQVCETLKKAGVPFWLFAERPAPTRSGGQIDQYCQYNWCPVSYNLDGEISSAGSEFLTKHFRYLAAMTTQEFVRVIANVSQREISEIQPAEVFGLMYKMEQEVMKELEEL